MSGLLVRVMDRWRLPVAPERVWAVLADPGVTWPDWWPGMSEEAAGVVSGPDGLGAPGSWVRLRLRSPIGGGVRIRLYLTGSRPPTPERGGRARLQVSGDLRGIATVHVSRPDDDAEPGCEVRLIWIVTARRGPALLATRISRRLAAWAHARVMSAGERGLRNHLTTPAR
ncbi:hypothetical protein [Myceligenerans crystallogenes]